MEIEYLHPNEVISCLWNKNASEKCRIGLADIVVYENGNPARWYYTGKTGEISKKRAVDIGAISQRWKRIGLQSESEYVAIMRQDGGILKFLGEEAWDSLCMNHGVTDRSVDSVHCFIKGTSPNIYRNSFELRDKLGRFLTSTHSYSYRSEQRGPEVVNIFSEMNAKFTESKATALKNIMDLATHTVIRYVEMMLSVKIIRITVDYIIDSKSQLWMLWTSEAQICRATSLADIKIPNFPSGDKLGRMSWAGPKFAEGEQEQEFRRREESPERSTLSPPRSPTRRILEEKFSAQEANAMVNSATSVIDEAVDATQTDKDATHKKRIGEDLTKHVIELNEQKVAINKFPDPFKCKGDFCNLKVHLLGPLTIEKGAEKHLEKQLFSEKELEILRKNKKFSKMLSPGAENPAVAMIAMKSIIMARKEKKSRAASDTGEGNIWEDYPKTPREKHTLKHHLDKLRATGVLPTLEGQEPVNMDDLSINSDIKNEIVREHEAQELLEKDKDHREAFTKAIPTYYEQVRVCGTCLNIYTLLDWARIELGIDDAHGAGLENLGDRKSPKRGIRPNRLGVSESESNLLKIDDVRTSTGEMSTTGPLPRTSSVSPSSRRRRQRSSDQKSTWKSYSKNAKENPTKITGDNFVNIDDYLRGNSKAADERIAKKKEKLARNRVGELAMSLDGISSSASVDSIDNLYRGKVILAYDNAPAAYEAQAILEDAFFDVNWCKDGREAINLFLEMDGSVDCVLVQRDLPLGNAFEIVKRVRDYERDVRKRETAKAAARGQGIQKPFKRHPVICYTEATTPEDLRVYMQSDMDGCVSYPVNRTSLLNTIRAAVPQHLAMMVVPKPPPDPNAPKVYKLGNLGLLEGSQDSATQAFQTLPIKTQLENDDSTAGVVQIDADTRIPYSVMDASKFAKVVVNSKKPFFNLVVCHDLFDTSEKMKVFFKPIVQKYLGMQVLLWNYPGQAYTEYRDEQLLNNEYHASCLNELLGQIGDKGTKDFDTSRPFFLLGFGHGTSIASFYSAYFHVPNLRGLLNVNGWAYVDSYLAGIMHDCINIFQYSPPNRPDLPIYFFSRFLFSKEYLAKVSVPLALNVYTAIHNPISLKGRVQLCKGVLQSVDVRPLLQDIDCPIICIQSTQDALSRPLHMESFVKMRNGEAKTIYKALQDPSKTCVVWMKSGHEVFQENKKPLRILFEQILTGFHESRNVELPALGEVDKAFMDQGKIISSLPGERSKTIEDNFIDVFLGNMNRVTAVENLPDTGGTMRQINSPNRKVSPNRQSSSPSGRDSSKSPGRRSSPGLAMNTSSNSIVFSSTDPNSWNEYSQSISDGQILGKMTAKKKRQALAEESLGSLSKFDASLSSFERQDSVVYGSKAKELAKLKGPNPAEFSEVKEYMDWRLKRNKKRLQRLQGAARIIQGAFRAFLARMFVRNLRRRKAATIIQRAFRGWLGRCSFLDQARRIWASQVIQRAWRGYLSRKWFFYVKLRIASAANIQRVFRGFRGRQRVKRIMKTRHKAACKIQALARRYLARMDSWRKRVQRNASVVIQRCYRGRLGRRKALNERDKYIFSRSQSQGIEFGRQMLLEHKLHATRLQSDVTLLMQEKVSAEEQVEALLEEISSFEDGVRTLQKEMHQLSKVEAEAAAFMDEESKFELREQKMRLDKEFGEMLAKIGNRKDMLNDLEKKLGSIDKSRQGKEEELRTLERKLVVLLEEQQNELNAIKKKQDVRGAMLAASHDEIRKLTVAAPGSQSQSLAESSQSLVVSGGSGGSGGGGPSLQEKRQAAQLMQSTETLMKFGFMSMSMTYFSSLNMIKALRTVSAQDTVMAALADVHAQRAVGHGAEGISAASSGGGSSGFLPGLKKGQMPGQESLKVSAWSVEDVSHWLQTLSLGQYVEAFMDAAVDGEFLYDLNDDDLKNTLGIEHRLHRKKILQCVHRLKIAEAQADSRINALLRAGDSNALEPPVIAPDAPANEFENGNQFMEDRTKIDGPKISIDELFSHVRHSKLAVIKEALEYLATKKFDPTLVQSNYVVNYGTAYVPGYEKLPFHINKTDDNGNTMLSLACQNGNEKITKYLVMKGANPNHQNKNGQSPAHFCIAYKFFELAQWLFENGALDTLTNKAGLTPYDGLDGDEEDPDKS